MFMFGAVDAVVLADFHQLVARGADKILDVVVSVVQSIAMATLVVRDFAEFVRDARLDGDLRLFTCGGGSENANGTETSAVRDGRSPDGRTMGAVRDGRSPGSGLASPHT